MHLSHYSGFLFLGHSCQVKETPNQVKKHLQGAITWLQDWKESCYKHLIALAPWSSHLFIAINLEITSTNQ